MLILGSVAQHNATTTTTFYDQVTSLSPRVWYQLSESSTGTPPQDSSGNNYHGISWNNSPPLQQLSLDPTNSNDYSFKAGNTTSGAYAELTNNTSAWNLGSGSPFSLAIVYQRWDTSLTTAVISRRDGTSTSHRQWNMSFSGASGLTFSVSKSGSWFHVNEGNAFPTDTNPHIAIGVHDYTNNRFEVWRDGTLEGSGTPVSSVQQSNSSARVGLGRGIGWTNTTCGLYISEFLYFDIALSTTEIANLSQFWT